MFFFTFYVFLIFFFVFEEILTTHVFALHSEDYQSSNILTLLEITFNSNFNLLMAFDFIHFPLEKQWRVKDLK